MSSKTSWMVPDRPAAWIAAVLLALFSPLAAADIEAGIAAYRQGDFAAALAEFQVAAKRDDMRALNYLGIMHAEGQGTPRDDRRAADLFFKAAILGHPEAMANLARMHAAGRGVTQDNKAAISGYRAAAKAGFQPAIIRMAEIYANGELGEAPDAALAREWRARLPGQPPQPVESPPRASSTPVQSENPIESPRPPAEAADSSPREAAAPGRNENAIETVAVSQQSGQTLIRVRARTPPAAPPASFTVANPPRIVFDFPNTVTSLGRSFDDLGEGDLRVIDVVQGSERTRMVLTLRNTMQYDVKVDGRELVITLRPTGAPAIDAGRP